MPIKSSALSKSMGVEIGRERYNDDDGMLRFVLQDFF